MTVYVDVLLLINFVINLLLLKTAAFILKESFSLKRASLGAFLGALSALFIFLPPVGIFLTFLYKLVFANLMIFLTFGCRSRYSFIKDTFVFLGCTFLFSGIINFIFATMKPSKMVVLNGTLYLDLSPVLLIFSAAASYVFVTAVNFFFGKRESEKSCILKIEHNGRKIFLKGLVDTGNSLTEPFSNLPVIVVKKGIFLSEVEEEKALQNNFRLIPFNSAGGGGIMKAFLAQSVKINCGSREKEIKKGCYIALSDEISEGGYDAVVNSEIL